MPKQLKVIIVDDEEGARDSLANLLMRVQSETSISIIDKCENLASAVDSIRRNKPDLVFLDIQMPNESGLQILDYFPEANFQIIFVTAYDSYAIRAFEMNALDYILKPIDRKRLEKSVQKSIQQIDSVRNLDNLKKMISNFKLNKKLTISDASGKQMIPYDDIVALEAKGSYCLIHTIFGSEILSSRNLKFYANQIGEDYRFFRSHKAWLVNLKLISGIDQVRNIVHLTNKIEARLTKTKTKQISEAIVKLGD